MGDARSSLHYLEDFALLKDRQNLIIRPQFVLFSFHEDRLLSLSVHSLIEEVLVMPWYLGGKPEATDKSYFYGSHKNYRTVIISNSKSYHATKIQEKDKSHLIANASVTRSRNASSLALLQHSFARSLFLSSRKYTD